MTRYYLDPRNDYVYTWGDDDGAVPDGCPEVRIVPADAIVIERDELPEVEYARQAGAVVRSTEAFPLGVTTTVGGGDQWVSDHARNFALAYLALAEYVAAHPPVDEAAKAAILAVLSDIPDGYGNRERVADALLRDPRVRVEATR